MDRYDLTQLLRQRYADAPTRFIAVTGYGQAADKARALRAGFHAHLVKPVQAEQLSQVIGEMG